MTKLQNVLLRAFSTNFMVYWQAHVAHVNLRGDDFLQLHAFLGEIYEDAQENIDTYAEFLRIIKAEMPASLGEIQLSSEITDIFPLTAPDYSECSVLCKLMYDNIETQIEVLRDLYNVAEAQRDYGLSGYVQERLITHGKQCWKLRMLLENENE